MKRSVCWFVGFIAWSLVHPRSIAQETPSAEIEKLISAHEKAIDEWRKKASTAPSGQRPKYPNPAEKIDRIREIVVEHPGESAVPDGVRWLIENSRQRVGGGADPEIFGIIEEHHINDPKVVEIAARLGFINTPECKQFLTVLTEKSEAKDVRGMALYSLAALAGRDEARVEEYTAMMEKVIKEHPGLEVNGRNIAKRAEGKLFAAKNLKIGMSAPEIVGKDVDGNEMKLSDYRGKVVVIDFWGDW